MASRYLLTPSIKWSSLVLLLVVGLPAAGLAQQQVYKVDVQGVHPNGTVIKISKVICEPTHTALQVQIVNGHRSGVRLNSSRGTFLRDAMGTLYHLSPPTDNDYLKIPAGEVLEGTLVFLGGIPVDSTEVTLIINSSFGGSRAEYTGVPRFDIKLPLRAEEMEQKKIRWRIDPQGAALSIVRSVALPRSELRASTLRSEVDIAAQLKSDLAATEIERGTLVSLPGDVLFDFDRADIRPDAEPTLKKVAELIAHSGNAPVAIEGHTDSLGTTEYNQTLSERRAAAVRDYLVERHGIAANRLTVQGYGFSRSVAPNTHPDGTDNPEGRQLNRRVEIVIGTD